MSIDPRFDDVLNFRDLGGLESEDGRKVRYGFFYRGAGLAYFNEEELKEFSRQRVVEDTSDEDERMREQAIQEYIESERIIGQAREKYEKKD